MSGEGRINGAAGVGELIGHARCSTVLQDLTARRQRGGWASLGVTSFQLRAGALTVQGRAPQGGQVQVGMACSG